MFTTVEIRRIRLPASYYLPRMQPDGREVRDVLPWENATSYVTDGKRIGVQFADESVTWIAQETEGSESALSGTLGVKAFLNDFSDVDVAALVEGIRSYMKRHEILAALWQEDLAALESLLKND